MGCLQSATVFSLWWQNEKEWDNLGWKDPVSVSGMWCLAHHIPGSLTTSLPAGSLGGLVVFQPDPSPITGRAISQNILGQHCLVLERGTGS